MMKEGDIFLREDTGRKIKKASNQMRRSFDQFGLQFDLTGPQMAIIDFINMKKDPVMQQDIETEFNIQRSTTSVVLQRLEKKGFIYRQTLPNDARQKSIHLTEKAQKASINIAVYLNKHQEEIEKRFSKEELATFDKVIAFFMNLEE